MYSPSQIVSAGTSAAAGSGVGVRKASMLIDRTATDAGADPAFIHFDILNTTSGSPDDTWITADYTTVETQLLTWWGLIASLTPTGSKYTEVRWHRTGTGVSKPNPAERTITSIAGTTGTGGGGGIPQAATSITFRTGSRRNWGRTYLPCGSNAITNGRLTNANCDTIANATNSMVTALATNDMHLVVVSKPLSSSLNVEQIEVDNVPDVIRRRRWKRQTYRKILP